MTNDTRLYSPKIMKDVLNRHNFDFKKTLGQNFLIDGNIVRRIVKAADIGPEDTVLEIGPGFGTLTEELALNAREVIAIEIDDRLKDVHKDVLGKYDNIKFIYDDILKVDLHKLIPKNFKVVANLPYYITSPIITNLISKNLPIDNMVFMVQKEVGERITAKSGTKAYGSLSLYIQYFGEAQMLFNVPATVFMPKPNVGSAVVKIVPKNIERELDIENFENLIKAAFSMRRKTLSNCICKSFGLSKPEVELILKKMGKKINVRGESLDLHDFIYLGVELKNLEQEIFLKRRTDMDDRHGELMKKLNEEEFLQSDNIRSLAELFKAMGDPTRLKILYVLSNDELCVQDIADKIGMSQSSVSHQLKSLRMIRLVKFQRNGKQMMYSLDDDHVYKLFNQGLEHIMHE